MLKMTVNTTWRLACLVLIMLAGFAPDVAFAANDAQEGVREPELRSGCDLRPDQLDEVESQENCASKCFTAMAIVSTKAVRYQDAARLAMLIGLLVTATLTAAGVFLVAKSAARANWPNGKKMGIQVGVTILGAAVGFGVCFGVHNSSAWPHAQSLYQDLLIMKQAGKAGAASVPGAGLACGDPRIKARVLADIKTPKPAFAALKTYVGVATRFERLDEDGAWTESHVNERWADISQVIQAADAIDPKQQAVTSVIDSAKVYKIVLGGIPFPGNPFVGLGLGALLGWIAAFVTRKATR